MSDSLNLVRSRAVVAGNYAILPPEGIPAGPIPHWPDIDVRVLTAPDMGADFSMMQMDVPADRGTDHELPADIQGFAFVLEGNVALDLDGRALALGPGGYAYVPPAGRITLTAKGGDARLLWTRKRYQPIGDERPAPVAGDETKMADTIYEFGSGNPLLPDTAVPCEGLILKTLLPDEMVYDMAMNIFTFEPGKGLPIIETHVMEHGLMFLEGQGMYYLGDTWYEVKKGDFIWMGPYVPQSFYATGDVPSRYIYYKNVHRDVVL